MHGGSGGSIIDGITADAQYFALRNNFIKSKENEVSEKAKSKYLCPDVAAALQNFSI